jgi:hypothetical protein
MKRYQYEPILFRECPHLRNDLLLGFIYSKEVVHAPFFFLAALAGLLSDVVGASLLPAAILALMWFVVTFGQTCSWTAMFGYSRLAPPCFPLSCCFTQPNSITTCWEAYGTGP